MKLALAARIKCDPKRVLENRWVHDTAHILADTLRKASQTEARKQNRGR